MVRRFSQNSVFAPSRCISPLLRSNRKPAEFCQNKAPITGMPSQSFPPRNRTDKAPSDGGLHTPCPDWVFLSADAATSCAFDAGCATDCDTHLPIASALRPGYLGNSSEIFRLGGSVNNRTSVCCRDIRGRGGVHTVLNHAEYIPMANPWQF